jgi:hypothetical protein
VSDEVFWRSDGTSFRVQYTTTPISEGDTLTGALVVFRDITERRRIEGLGRPRDIRSFGYRALCEAGRYLKS